MRHQIQPGYGLQKYSGGQKTDEGGARAASSENRHLCRQPRSSQAHRRQSRRGAAGRVAGGGVRGEGEGAGGAEGRGQGA